MRALAGSPPVPPPGSGTRVLADRASASALTEVELVSIEQRLAQWIRFGRIAAMRPAGQDRHNSSLRPGAVIAVLRWSRSDFGTVHASIAILSAAAPDARISVSPRVRPGGDILLHVDDDRLVRQVLRAIDDIEAARIDPCDVAPDHWRHIGSHVAAGLPFRPYGAERHRAWQQRQALGS